MLVVRPNPSAACFGRSVAGAWLTETVYSLAVPRAAGDALPVNQAAAPEDGGETLDLSPARLTITVGFGPTLSQKFGRDRYGIAKRKPEAGPW
ncbi:Dyp-type peroxidase domain-containing protein [Flindersiella endophytica]